MSIWGTILTALGGAAMVLGAVAWLVREIIVRILDKDVESYKTKLQGESDKKLEELKSELRMVEFRSSKLHEKRAEVVAELYGRLVRAIDMAYDFVFSGISAEPPGVKERAKKAEEAIKDLIAYYGAHRIYFDSQICEQLDALILALSHATMGFDTMVVVSNQLPDKADLFQIRKESLQQIKREAAPIRLALEREFRQILGVIEKDFPKPPTP